MSTIKNSMHAYNVGDKIQENIKEELRRALHLVLANNKEMIRRLEDVEKVSEWYKEAKEKGQDGVLSKIINRIIEELFNQNIDQYFINSIIENIKVQVRIEANKVKVDAIVNFRAIKGSIEFVKILDGKELPSTLKFVFKIDVAGKFNGLMFSSDKYRKEISMDKFNFTLTISIIELPTHRLLNPIVLYCNDQFKIENLRFSL